MNTRISLIGLGLAIALFLALNLLAAPALHLYLVVFATN